MRIISFDVGIKNLACCVLDVKSSIDFEILFWDVLNLTNPTVYPPCSNDSCNNKVKHMFHNEEHYYCTRHGKKNTNDHKIVPEEMVLSKLKKNTQKELFSMAESIGLEPKKPITKKMLLSMIEQFVKDNYLIPIPSEKKASDMDLISVGKELKKSLEQHLQCFEPYDHVVIENQISPIASRMKTVQGMIAYHYIMRNPTSHIQFISASNKLNTFTDEKIETYGDRKKAAVVISKQLLNNFTQFSVYNKYLDKNGKKDDLADCFLQLLYYVHFRNILPPWQIYTK